MSVTKSQQLAPNEAEVWGTCFCHATLLGVGTAAQPNLRSLNAVGYAVGMHFLHWQLGIYVTDDTTWTQGAINYRIAHAGDELRQ
jgi:hypothetical protein